MKSSNSNNLHNFMSNNSSSSRKFKFLQYFIIKNILPQGITLSLSLYLYIHIILLLLNVRIKVFSLSFSSLVKLVILISTVLPKYLSVSIL